MRLMFGSLQKLHNTFGDFDIRSSVGDEESDFLGTYTRSYLTIRFGHYQRVDDITSLKDVLLNGTEVTEVCFECEERGLLYEYELRR